MKRDSVSAFLLFCLYSTQLRIEGIYSVMLQNNNSKPAKQYICP